MKRLIFTLISATALWTVMFSPPTAPHINFWWMMTASAITLTALSTCFRPHLWKELHWTSSNILTGIATAAALWGIFWIGNELSAWMFDFARPKVDTIYGMKEGESPWILTALMLLIIGPAEEIYWRGYVQHELSARWNANIGYIITTTIYALVHAGACNFMLLMAALVAGAFWGLLYRFFPDRLAALVLSHALWDCAVFIWWPI